MIFSTRIAKLAALNLAMMDDLRTKRLASELGCTRRTAYRHIIALEGDGHVEKSCLVEPETTGRPETCWRITSAGKRRLRRLQGR